MLTDNSTSQQKSIGLVAVLLAVLAILILTLAPANTQALTNVQPALLTLAETQPDTAVRVIVYQANAHSALEQLITELKGTVVRDLQLISALAVEIPARAIPALAGSAGVAKITLDGQMVSASTLTETVEVRISSSADDAEEEPDGAVDLASTDLELVYDGGNQIVGMRFRNLQIPQGAAITSATVEFETDETDSTSTSLVIQAEAVDDAAVFTSSDDNISDRSRTAAAVNWTNIPAWNTKSEKHQTPDISAVIQEVVSRGGWNGGNDLVVIITGSGERTAESYDGESSNAPLLHVEYSVGENPPPPVEPPGAGAITIRDEFNNVAYNNNDGSQNWASDWIEVDESDGPSTGNMQVRTDGALELANYNNSLHRAVDLSGAGTAVLSLEYRRESMQTSNELSLEISADGGGSWTELDRFVGTGTDDANFLSASYDILPYASADTVIRFIIIDMGWNDYLYVDSIQIAYTENIVIPPNYYPDTLNVRPIWDMGIQGQGVTIAVVDSGLSPENDFDGRISTRVGFNGEAQTNDDGFGHGTHVSGIIAGSYTGIAPQANLIGLKVSDDSGMAYESDTVAALQWVFENKDAYNIRIVNLSLNSSLEQSYNESALDAAVEILWLNNIVVVASAGNAWGPFNTVKAAPANDPFIITVGASEEGGTSDRNNDWVAAYTQHGDTISGFHKPEVIAPGQDIISVLASSSSWKTDYPERYVDGGYFRISGTSMAAPMVSGAVALLLQAEPNLTPDQVKYRLMNTGSDIYFNGAYPYLDVYDLLTTPTTESANADVIPHELLAKMALVAYWASANGDENIDWANVDWDAVDWDGVDWNSVNWGSVNWGSVNWGSVNWGSVNWGSVNWGSVNWGSVNWGSVNWGSVNWGSVNWGSVSWGSVSWDD